MIFISGSIKRVESIIRLFLFLEIHIYLAEVGYDRHHQSMDKKPSQNCKLDWMTPGRKGREERNVAIFNCISTIKESRN